MTRAHKGPTRGSQGKMSFYNTILFISPCQPLVLPCAILFISSCELFVVPCDKGSQGTHKGCDKGSQGTHKGLTRENELLKTILFISACEPLVAPCDKGSQGTRKGFTRENELLQYNSFHFCRAHKGPTRGPQGKMSFYNTILFISPCQPLVLPCAILFISSC